MQGDTLRLNVVLGHENVSTDANGGQSSQAIANFAAYISTASADSAVTGENDCDGGCINKYYMKADDAKCALGKSTDGTCKVQCENSIDITLSTAHYNITPSPVRSGGDTKLVFTAILLIFYD